MSNELKPIAYVGIDPGKNGGIVAITTNGMVIQKTPTPLLGDGLDVLAIQHLFTSLIGVYTPVVILEDVHSIFGSSASSNFTFGYVCGAIEAIVLCQRMKLIKVQPKKWQAEIWQNSDKVYKAKKPDQKNPSIDTKATSLSAVSRLFPNVDLRKTERSKIAADGIVDALLLAEYGRRRNF